MLTKAPREITAYLAGPMTGRPNYNFAAFNEAAARLRSFGFTIINPAENFNGDTTLPYETYLKHDFKLILDCDAIILLPGWKASKGAQREQLLASWCGIPHYEYEDILEVLS